MEKCSSDQVLRSLHPGLTLSQLKAPSPKPVLSTSGGRKRLRDEEADEDFDISSVDDAAAEVLFHEEEVEEEMVEKEEDEDSELYDQESRRRAYAKKARVARDAKKRLAAMKMSMSKAGSRPVGRPPLASVPAPLFGRGGLTVSASGPGGIGILLRASGGSLNSSIRDLQRPRGDPGGPTSSLPPPLSSPPQAPIPRQAWWLTGWTLPPISTYLPP